MSYIPSINDDSRSIPVNKANNHRGNINYSKKYIQPKNNNITGTNAYTKIQNFTSRQKKIIIPTRPNLHKNINKSKTTKNQKSKNLVNTHRKLKNDTKNSNKNNINIQNNNNTDTIENNGRYGKHRHNKNNDLRGKKQFIKEEEYDSRFFRHLRSIESRVKNYSNPKNKNIQE